MVPLALHLPGIHFSPVKLLILLLIWAVTLWRLPAALRSPQQRPLWNAFAGVTGLLTIGLPAVASQVDRLGGVPDLALLLEHLLGLFACSAGLTFCGRTARPELAARWRRPQLATLITAQLGLVLCFARLHHPTETADFYQDYPRSGTACLYALIVVGYLGVSMGTGSWLFGTYARRAGTRSLRLGLAVLGLGTATGFGYALLRGWQILLETAGRPMCLADRWLYRVEWTATALVVVGSLIPALGVACRGLRDRLIARRLHPLWAELTAAVPEVVLAERLGRGPRLRLHRLVIEIRDAALVLAPYAAEEARHRAGAAPDERTGALAEASWLRTAIARRAGGQRPAEHREAPPPPAPAGPACPDELDELDFDSETRRLVRLAAAYARTAAPG
ncbi:MAB_1171c family putative transporter [Kitasatospora viridis]|uniref:DUF6545 domain-containing protein n=1 Tax=Kitasatospora viridis TaxID=281105 RepID=A0A561UH10_9ACTN|nr:MAB_1171c family putative transporter [Kitasatospora viridis]TWF98659.1 hypothetical protein FHX73_112480 [Kitasatospora viridis]